MQNFGSNWPDEVVLQLANQICDEIDQKILRDILKESNKFIFFLNPPNYPIVDQMILDWYKSLIGIK